MNTVAVHQIHTISHGALARAVPNLRPFDIHLELRQEFAAWTARQRNTYPTWQVAWNDWTRATARPGTVHLSAIRRAPLNTRPARPGRPRPDHPTHTHRWRFDDLEAPGAPIVCAHTALDLAPISPLHLLLAQLTRPSAEPGPIVATAERWQAKVHAHGVAHPEWITVTVPTLTDGMPIMPPSPLLDGWLARQRRDFPHWASTYGGTYDYSPDTLNALGELIFRHTPSEAAFEDPANAHFAEGATWYVGEMMCRADPARWMYRAHKRGPDDPLLVCFTIQTNDNGDFTTPFWRILNMLKYRDPSRLRSGYDAWEEIAQDKPSANDRA